MAEPRPITIQDARGTLSTVFSEATTPEQRLRGARLAATAFGKSLSQEGYLKRDEFLSKAPLASGPKGWHIWNLTVADDPEHVIAMCKTMHRDLLLREGVEPTVRQEQGYCVCSVVTDSRYRGRGLASVLLKSVAEWIDGPGGAAASMLYSDVGDFYVSKGWDILDAFQTVMTVPSSLPPRDKIPKLPLTRPITSADIPSLCERDVESLKYDFENKSDLPPDTVLTTVLPTPDLINWLQTRADYMNDKLANQVPTSKGSICESADAWVYWFTDIHGHKITIQRIKPPKDQSEEVTTHVLAALLFDVLEEAAKWKISEIIIWNPSPELHTAIKSLAEKIGVRVVNEKRDTAQIPCLRWRGGEKKKTVFSPNEYYAWS
ncbi:uncharacterized protein F4822DRAFT_421111 [Hypoxylon trugodes]|uniref:uncharacterized protein n=1 Tax=Hypoxylon trugodes TaxID=326681 RepID=UPI00218F66B9|nr:uncharacterized protein F4822DRAFT_421111 [Hypoxylon trugodes]KAI1383600.1 hypothetical protein F4822DRAFT_421111 [Hypoxylon trugodes]